MGISEGESTRGLAVGTGVPASSLCMLVFVCVFCVQQPVSVAGVGLKPQGLCTWGDKDAGAAAGQLEGLSWLPEGLNSFIQCVYSVTCGAPSYSS